MNTNQKIIQPRKRCPNGTHKNRKTGECEAVIKVKKRDMEQPQPQHRKRCPNGTRKNKITGLCEPKEKKTIRQTQTQTQRQRQTKMDMYYPKTRRTYKYIRKEKTPKQIQTKLTQYLQQLPKTPESYPVFESSDNIYYTPLSQDRNSFEEKKTTLAKKIAAKKIGKFMIQPEVQEKRRGAFLKSICSDSNVCIAFGIEDKKIQEYFSGFTDFDYAVPLIKRIGQVSANGFVNEIMYERNNYIAYSVLKSSVNKNADNLMYEYIIGNYLNKMSMYYPCFLKTYGIYEYVNSADYNHMQKNKIINDAHILKRGLKQLRISEPATISQLLKSCTHSQYISVLTQHVKDAIPINDIYNINIYFLLYQVYFTLNCMRNHYTHYDLHTGNVLCYQPASNAYIEFMYHLDNGNVVDFISTDLAYIIDYGRSYFYENKKNNSDAIRSNICKTNCPSICGKTEGYGILHGALKSSYEIDSHVSNVSADLRLLHILQESNNIELSEKIVFTKTYGTPQKIDSGLPRAIHNVSDALEVITKKVSNYKNEMMRFVSSMNYAKLGTIHVYENGKTPVRFEKA